MASLTKQLSQGILGINTNNQPLEAVIEPLGKVVLITVNSKKAPHNFRFGLDGILQGYSFDGRFRKIKDEKYYFDYSKPFEDPNYFAGEKKWDTPSKTQLVVAYDLAEALEAITKNDDPKIHDTLLETINQRDQFITSYKLKTVQDNLRGIKTPKKIPSGLPSLLGEKWSTRWQWKIDTKYSDEDYVDYETHMRIGINNKPAKIFTAAIYVDGSAINQYQFLTALEYHNPSTMKKDCILTTDTIETAIVQAPQLPNNHQQNKDIILRNLKFIEGALSQAAIDYANNFP